MLTLLLVLACSGDVDDGPDPPGPMDGGSTDGGATDGGETDGGWTDAGSTPAGPVTLRSAPEGELLVGTRYDAVIDFEGGSATWTLDGAAGSCQGVQTDHANGLHCRITPSETGPVTLTAATLVDDVALSWTARDPAGLWPSGDHLPIGLYQVYSQDAMQSVADAGIKIVHTYDSDSYTHLEWQGWAAETGLFTLTDAQESAHIDAYRHLEQIAWWDLPEEQRYWYPDELAAVQELSAAIRAVDDRPVYMYIPGHYPADDIAPYLPYLDVVGTGAYVEYSSQPHAWLRWRVEENRRAIVDNGADADAYIEAVLLQLFEAHGTPTATTVTFDLWAALAAGAESVHWFGWWYAENVLDPEAGTALLDAVTVLTDADGPAMAIAHGTRADLGVTIASGPEDGPAFTPLYTDEQTLPAVQATVWDWQGTRWAIIVNSAEETVTATVDGMSGLTRVQPLHVRGPTLESIDGQLEVELTALDWQVYRWVRTD